MPSDDAAPPSPARLLGLTVQIVAAHASRNPVAAEQLPELIRAVHRVLGGLGQNAAPADPVRPEPAVPIRRSVRPDRIMCLECGVAFKMIKRHLGTEHHFTPEAYRERWGLPRDYPMVVPDYAEVRTGIAKRIGLGRKRDGQAEAAAPLAPDEPEDAPDAPAAGPDMAGAEPQGAVADTESAAPAMKGRRRKRNAQPEDEAPTAAAPNAPVPARGRRRRRARDTGTG